MVKTGREGLSAPHGGAGISIPCGFIRSSPGCLYHPELGVPCAHRAEPTPPALCKALLRSRLGSRAHPWHQDHSPAPHSALHVLWVSSAAPEDPWGSQGCQRLSCSTSAAAVCTQVGLSQHQQCPLYSQKTLTQSGRLRPPPLLDTAPN